MPIFLRGKNMRYAHFSENAKNAATGEICRYAAIAYRRKTEMGNCRVWQLAV